MKSRSEARAEKEAASTSTDEAKKKAVEETSAQLREELRPKAPKPSPFKFESANAAKEDKLREDLDKIVETVFVNDVHETWKRLREALVIGEKRSDHGTLQKALDKAEENAYDAHRLWITGKVEWERWERENDVVFGAMRSEATASLQKEKEDGVRSKQVTDADVTARIATLFPDEFQAQEFRRAKVKATIASLESLAVRWDSRCRTLGTMLSKLRG